MRHWMLSMLFAAVAMVGAGPAQAAPPRGWILAGSEPGSYEVGTDPGIRHGGRASGYLKSTVARASGFGTLMQSFTPGRYAGKRVRLSAWVKADRVTDWAALWMRVDDASDRPLAFDNMEGRPIKGTRDWARHVVVLDVDRRATNVAFGVLLGGTGAVWLDDVTFEIVDRSVPTTDLVRPHGTSGTPQNIGFDE